MKIVKNGYTRTKLNGVYADHIDVLDRTILTGMNMLLEKEEIKTGEPVSTKDGMGGFYLPFCTFLYDNKKDEIVLVWGQEFRNDGGNYKKSRYKQINEKCLSDIKKFIDSKAKHYALNDCLNKLDSFRDYKEDWNSYRCNPVAVESINSCKEFLTAIFEKINQFEVSLYVYAMADGGNVVRRPPEGSMSTCAIELENGYRKLEFEIEKDGSVSAFMFEHAYDENTHESLGLNYPLELKDEYIISDFENDEYLKWAIEWIHYEK